jgi:hypothetical protein
MKARLDYDKPAFFAGKRGFVMFADNCHTDGRIAIWAPAVAG